ncbi:hypothetical protein LOAG_11436 [Loa loa]|uniref:DUF19 domain-containing protein n=1 Tax=Loa loa TaxID=7209 RepID=A0A1S0TPH8_LOALO|nr:hypothetical protein LOAG_11436 [Loa loa]EFO17069.2 hypothetical protein LOAG_11436 [Loa loa]
MLDACTIEAQNVVVEVQDALNDDLIMHHCYAETITDTKLINDDEFKLNPKNVRCNSEQENLALTCLVELVEVNRKVAELNSLNFLHEISQPNSTIISGICNLYNKYDNCIRLDYHPFVVNVHVGYYTEITNAFKRLNIVPVHANPD